jgi:hypothetical protein
VLAVIFCVSGAGLALIGARHFSRRLAFVRNSAVAAGEVIAVRPDRDGTEVHGFAYPRIRFQTASGRIITFESEMARSGTAWQVGAPVQVRYQLDRPEVAELDGFVALWGAPSIFAVLALIFFGVGSVLLIRG